jgi:predicted AlkP superfamily phosphohydrolase/phosphomutase
VVRQDASRRRPTSCTRRPGRRSSRASCRESTACTTRTSRARVRKRPKAIGPGHYGEPPFWQRLDGAGRRSIIFDAPETFPISGYRGVQVFEWSTWAWYWRRMTTPTGLEPSLKQRFGEPPLRLEARKLGLGFPRTDVLMRELLENAPVKARMTRWLMQEHPWDAFVVVFAEPHPAGHYLWPAGLTADAATSGGSDVTLKAVREIYAAVDAAIGVVVEACPDDTTVIVISGDGVGPNHCGWHLLPQILQRAGFAHAQGCGAGATAQGRRTMLQRLRDSIPPGARSAISARLPWQLRDRLVSRVANEGIDWSRSVAFSLPTDLEGCIRINLKGREPNGIVEGGPHYEDVCAAVTDAALALLNPATGARAVQEVCRIDQRFPGERRQHLPDLVLRWADGAPISELYSDRTGLVSGAPPDPRTGTHHPRSFVALRGPGVRRGALEAGHHLVDVAPTVLACLGVEAPASMAGRSLRVAG